MIFSMVFKPHFLSIYREVILIFWVPVFFRTVIECETAAVRNSAVSPNAGQWKAAFTSNYKFPLSEEQPKGISGSSSVP